MYVIAEASSGSISSIFVWCGVLVAALLAGFAGYSYLKRWMNQTDEGPRVGFTLSDLRDLHRQGKMTDQEFEQTKALMLGSAKKAAEQMPAVLPRRTPKPPAPDRPSPPPTA
jgi:hypothetical protein